jgi:hypothetical protein
MRIKKLSANAKKNVIASWLTADALLSVPALYFDGMVEKVEAKWDSSGL